MAASTAFCTQLAQRDIDRILRIATTFGIVLISLDYSLCLAAVNMQVAVMISYLFTGLRHHYFLCVFVTYFIVSVAAVCL